jgi:calmodulin
MPREMEQAERLHKVYQLFVDSPTERIPGNRIMDALRFAGYIVSEEDLVELSGTFSEEGATFEELQVLCSRLRERDISREDLLKSFRSLDPDNTSFIDAGQLVKILTQGEDRFQEEELEELLNILNPDGDGKICYELLVKKIYGH